MYGEIMKILIADGTDFIDYLKDNGIDNERLMGDWMHGYETCKYKLAQFLMPQIEQLAQEESYKADAERLKLKCNQLIGLAKSASGYLVDANSIDKADLILNSIPDIELSEAIDQSMKEGKS